MTLQVLWGPERGPPVGAPRGFQDLSVRSGAPRRCRGPLEAPGAPVLIQKNLVGVLLQRNWDRQTDWYLRGPYGPSWGPQPDPWGPLRGPCGPHRLWMAFLCQTPALIRRDKLLMLASAHWRSSCSSRICSRCSSNYNNVGSSGSSHCRLLQQMQRDLLTQSSRVKRRCSC